MGVKVRAFTRMNWEAPLLYCPLVCGSRPWLRARSPRGKRSAILVDAPAVPLLPLGPVGPGRGVIVVVGFIRKVRAHRRAAPERAPAPPPAPGGRRRLHAARRVRGHRVRHCPTRA